MISQDSSITRIVECWRILISIQEQTKLFNHYIITIHYINGSQSVVLALAASAVPGNLWEIKTSNPQISLSETLGAGPLHQLFTVTSTWDWWPRKLDSRSSLGSCILSKHPDNRYVIYSVFRKSGYYYPPSTVEETETHRG